MQSLVLHLAPYRRDQRCLSHITERRLRENNAFVKGHSDRYKTYSGVKRRKYEAGTQCIKRRYKNGGKKRRGAGGHAVNKKRSDQVDFRGRPAFLSVLGIACPGSMPSNRHPCPLMTLSCQLHDSLHVGIIDTKEGLTMRIPTFGGSYACWISKCHWLSSKIHDLREYTVFGPCSTFPAFLQDRAREFFGEVEQLLSVMEMEV
jgi:hypothetical protein